MRLEFTPQWVSACGSVISSKLTYGSWHGRRPSHDLSSGQRVKLLLACYGTFTMAYPVASFSSFNSKGIGDPFLPAFEKKLCLALQDHPGNRCLTFKRCLLRIVWGGGPICGFKDWLNFSCIRIAFCFN